MLALGTEVGVELLEDAAGAFFAALDGVETVEVDALFGVGQAGGLAVGLTAMVVSEVDRCWSSTHMS